MSSLTNHKIYLSENDIDGYLCELDGDLHEIY